VFLIDAVDRERFPEAKRELDVSRPSFQLLFVFVAVSHRSSPPVLVMTGSLDLRGARECSFPHPRK
jgi:hypothetical protein